MPETSDLHRGYICFPSFVVHSKEEIMEMARPKILVISSNFLAACVAVLEVQAERSSEESLVSVLGSSFGFP